ncbi:nitroreductase family protein [candidate division KSB1 bacterium]
MTFEEILNNRRSIRNYQNKPVSEETIKEIIEESILAPSSGNGQPWEFIVVNNKDMLKRMSLESKRNILDRINANPDDYAGKYRRILENELYNVYHNAPCLVIILGQSSVKNLYIDCTLAASYFMMAATSRGLGTCWVNLGADIQNPEMIKELGIPENSKIIAPLTLGYPVKIPGIPSRKKPNIIKIIT